MALDPTVEDNPIEENSAHLVPEPEEKGWPAPKVIEALGNRKLGNDHQAWHHIWVAHVASETSKQSAIHVWRGLIELLRANVPGGISLLQAVASACAGVSGYFLVSNQRSKPARSLPVVLIDLTNAGTLSGSTKKR